MDRYFLKHAAVESDLIYRDDHSLDVHLSALSHTRILSIGQSREGRPLWGIRIGNGARQVSVIAGSHADEPVGPMTAQALPSILQRDFPELLEAYTFSIVPQINPDGAERNAVWFQDPLAFKDYYANVIREAPGDDIEFGFADDAEARPECRAVMDFLKENGPYQAHFSLHGMAYAAGVWFLIDPAWIERSVPLRDSLAALCAGQNLPLHDIDRKGDKGFTRIAPGFCSTPNATAMQAFFLAHNDPEMAARFRPSSMEFVRSLGGDPLCMVSEIPLFLLRNTPPSMENPPYLRFKADLVAQGATEALLEGYGVEALPLSLQVRIQFAMLLLALEHTSS